MRIIIGVLLWGLAWPAAAQEAACERTPLPPAEPEACAPPLPPEGLGLPGEPTAPYSCGEARVFTVDFPLVLPAPELRRPAADDPEALIRGALAELSPFRRFLTSLRMLALRFRGALSGRPLTSKQAAEAIGLITPAADGPDTFPEALSQRLLADIQGRAGAELPGWFCPEGACGEACREALGTLRVDVASLLPERDVNGRRADGHRRFWRIRFTSDRDERDPFFAVQPAAQCALMDLLRPAAQGVAREFGVPPDRLGQIKVGRQACVVRPMSVDPQWPAQAMFLEPPARPLQVDPAVRPVVALIDTGVDPARHPDALEFDVLGLGPDPYDAGPNPHGSAMGDFVRAFVGAGGAELWSYRVMDAGGTGPVGAVARALDEALFNDNRPLVANLSLAWLPEYERTRKLADDCGATEDAAGEAVRYLLAVARELDSRQRPVLVVAAGGNRPLDNETPEAFFVDQAAEYGACTAGWWAAGRSPMLVPAEWTRTWVGAQCGGARPPLVAVGAVDLLGRRSSLAVPDPLTEPPLVAPGEHVTDGRRNVWSGSSVSAAFTSGAVARLWASYADRGVTLSGAETAALLNLAARDLGRATWGNAPVRHLAADRLHQAAACPDLQWALSCLVEGFEPAECWNVCELFGAEPDPALPGGPVEPGTACEAAWDEALAAEDACSLANDWRACVPDGPGQVRPGRALSFDQAGPGESPDRGRSEALGRVGPQPTWPPCGACIA
ncbi:MAG: S8/S53 family peptidase, partial [Myxococcales bacterium]|nr:S8/S53 family peptidase [Myxococcales bacterium]